MNGRGNESARRLAHDVSHHPWALVTVVGLGGGVVGAAFVGLLHALGHVLDPASFTDVDHLVVLGLVGLAIGVLTLLLGNPGDVELLVDNIHVSGSPAGIRNLRALLPVSLLGISAGSAIGPEAPLVQTTGSLAGWLARKRMLAVPDARVLTITGMAAGFSVLFGAPLGSALFALEILHRRGLQYHEALLPAVWGALCGYAVSAALTVAGMRTVWTFPSVTRVHGGDLLIGVAAGVAGAAVAAAFTYASHWARRLFRVLPAVARPLAGGLALGALAFASPYALTFGEGQIGHLSVAAVAVGTFVLALVAKFAATTLIGASGWRGGFIIPLFFMGVVLGSLGWELLGVHRTVAMAACMVACNVGVTKTPLGSVVVVAEMAGLPVLAPALLASLVALVLTSRVAMIQTQREREGVFDAPDGPDDDRQSP